MSAARRRKGFEAGPSFVGALVGLKPGDSFFVRTWVPRWERSRDREGSITDSLGVVGRRGVESNSVAATRHSGVYLEGQVGFCRSGDAAAGTPGRDAGDPDTASSFIMKACHRSPLKGQSSVDSGCRVDRRRGRTKDELGRRGPFPEASRTGRCSGRGGCLQGDFGCIGVGARGNRDSGWTLRPNGEPHVIS